VAAPSDVTVNGDAMWSRALGPLAQYRAYHLDPVNLRLHLVCVPAIAWSLLVLLAAVPVAGPVTVAHGLTVVVSGWYLWLAGALGLVAAGLMVVLLVCALLVASLDGGVMLALGVFAAGWVVQFIGHARFERLRPAFVTDLRQLFVAPLFVMAEVALLVGWKPAFGAAMDGRARVLRAAIEAARS
jgi:uncharacterized membrane protein YGL010W